MRRRSRPWPARWRHRSRINAWDNLYCLGYGATYPIALEGALKLKEITYAHCEGCSTEFKHGPLSAVTAGFPIIFVAGPADIPLVISGINEVRVRGARTITIAEEDARLRANGDVLVAIPKSDPRSTRCSASCRCSCSRTT